MGGITDDFGIMKTASALNNLTHPHVDSEQSCRLFLFLLHQLIDPYEAVASKKDFYKFLHHWMKTLEAGKLGGFVSDALDADLKSLNPNRYVVTTLSLAIGAIYQTWDDGISPKEHYLKALHTCIRVGDDTDTTSAVAGAMLGAIYGEECLPENVVKIFGYAGEKYPHVTFFFNGGREEPFEGEERILCPSPKVATYDLQPEMSAFDIRDAIVTKLKAQAADFVCLNFANPDMVGHTGDMAAAIKACETVDGCTADVVAAAKEGGYCVIIIADHGNCDTMINPDGSPNTAHTTNLVPVYLIDGDAKSINKGALCNIAPTVLDLMGIVQPAAMTSKSLL